MLEDARRKGFAKKSTEMAAPRSPTHLSEAPDLDSQVETSGRTVSGVAPPPAWP